MKVKIHKEKETVQFRDLQSGDVFIMDDTKDVWIKLSDAAKKVFGDYNAFDPCDGQFAYVIPTALVIPCPNAILLVDGE